MTALPDLPIRAVLPELGRALAVHGRAVLEAPPGAGKTTLVPLALLEASWREGGRVIVLQPRRLATRAAAARMAELLGESVGQTVGYAMRFERKIGKDTQVEVLTEGLFLRRLQADPELRGVAAVIFDEFHERSLDIDLALALTLESRSVLRPDLRVLVMSATLDGLAVARLLDDAPVVQSLGRMYPVEVRHLGRDPSEPIEQVVSRACLDAVTSEPGSILAFLPGQAEIARTAARLTARLPKTAGIEIHPLFGDLGREAQDRAIRPAPSGRRKIVLATDIAETSLTIEGIRVVVDSGLARKPSFSPRTGTSALVTRRIALANAEQRRGRAGRLEPGCCLRLWSKAEERAMLPHLPPEIATADLIPLVLELRLWGVEDPGTLAWLDPPPPAAMAAALSTLETLGALDRSGRVTAAGRQIGAMPVHPRLAAMILTAEERGLVDTGFPLAACLSARDFLGSAGSADLALRLMALRDGGGEPQRRRQILDIARQLGRGRFTPQRIVPERCGLLLASAYPDRIARQRTHGSYLLANGRGARLDAADPLAGEPWLVMAAIDDRGADGICRSAAALPAADLPAGRFTERQETRIDSKSGRVVARRVTSLGAIEVAASETRPPDAEAIDILIRALAARLPGLIEAVPAARDLRRRVYLLRGLDDSVGLPDWSDEALIEQAATLVDGWIDPARSLDAATLLDWHAVLAAQLSHDQRSRLDRELPTHWRTPAGTRHTIDYASDPPVFAARLQEMFGATCGPVLAGGRIACVLHLLSPANRPAAVTTDLAGFWESGWPMTRKELKGRYPKHLWPDDPGNATATTKAKPRSVG